MKQRFCKTLLLASVIFTLGGCFTNHERPNMAVGGMATGAVAGAIVGGTTNLNTADSILVGAGAGLLTGVILDVYSSDFQSALDDNDQVIQKNSDTIAARQKEIEALRDEVKLQTAETEINTEANHYLYNGPSLGSYTR